MDQASRPDESRERAVSSEPCSTRPNPFGDNEISSRKRRRTSLSGASRSLSADSNDSSTSLTVDEESKTEAQDESAMKIDTDPTTPQTPEQQKKQSPPPSETRSSRVTINVRTPSRLLEPIPSTPPSPRDSARAADQIPSHDANASVEESVLDERHELPSATPASSTSDASSPPVEVIPIPSDSDTTFDTGPTVTILPNARLVVHDPTGDLPFQENNEPLADTVNRIAPFFHTHEPVASGLAEWAENFFNYATSVPFETAQQSYFENRDLWAALPDIVYCMTNRKVPYPREHHHRTSIFSFFRAFAKLTAFWLEFDLKTLRNTVVASELSHLEFPSVIYIAALAILTRPDETRNAYILGGGGADEAFNYVHEARELLLSFQHVYENQGGSLAYLSRFAQFLIGLMPRFPRVCDNLASVTLLASNIVRDSSQSLNGQYTAEQAKVNIGRGYLLFKDVSAALTSIIEKHVNHLTFDAAQTLTSALSEIYLRSLQTPHVVPLEVLKDHQQNYPQVIAAHLPLAMSHHWKFSTFTKLIMSSQMQLRVMAVTTMCADLVSFWRMHGDTGQDADENLVKYMSDFLLRTGLVAYILGPTCHPEITIESSNIIGFLVVSRTYTNAHTDALWKTFTSTQDPRIAEALLRMMQRITNLFSLESLFYLCEKLNTLPVDGFTAPAREFCDNVFGHIKAKVVHDRPITQLAPWNLCARLLRQSCVFGTQTPIAYPDVQQFAINKFKEFCGLGVTDHLRQTFYAESLADIASRSPTTLGSLWVIYLIAKPTVLREVRMLSERDGLTQLIVDELEVTMPAARLAGFPAVLSGPHNFPRREIITNIVVNEPSAVTRELGRRLWDLLVGSSAACREDRDAAWHMLNLALKRSGPANPFVTTCFQEYLPSLAAECFCHGALEFVREAVLPSVNDPSCALLDDEGCPEYSAIDQLWRMVLTAPEGTVEVQAICTLACDIYVESQSILSFPHYRARKVHLALVDRCLKQMSSAAAKLKSYSDGTASGDDEPMVIVATDQQVQQQELLFSRSLSVLREFHILYQAKDHFSAPDLSSLMTEPPKSVMGEPAELKYQSFDGDLQTEVTPLNIGMGNTAGSLLASLSEATGFKNYRLYYRGKPLVPLESDVRQSLEALNIHNGILLVKRDEDDAPVRSTRVVPGASPVEVDILGHFEELWDYLTMEDKLARETFKFLVRLPPDEGLIRALESKAVSYKDIFPLGQPLKSLYALRGLQNHLSKRLDAIRGPSGEQGASKTPPPTLPAALSRAMSLVVAAILDAEVISQCPSEDLKMDLCAALVECFCRLLQDPLLPSTSFSVLDAELLDRLLAMYATIGRDTSDKSIEALVRCVQAIFECCARSTAFWCAFKDHRKIPLLMATLLLHDGRPEVRGHTARFIFDKFYQQQGAPSSSSPAFRDFFWSLIMSLVKPALNKPGNCAELLRLCLSVFEVLRMQRCPVLDIKITLREWAELLLSYTTIEDVTRPDVVDDAAVYLIGLLRMAMCNEKFPVERELLPAKGTARKLFWKHLYPPFEHNNQDNHGDIFREEPRPILNDKARSMLVDILSTLVGDDPTQLTWLLNDLNELVPVCADDEDYYAYDLPFQFERLKHIRAPCGYVGLRNLSNTCYLNSLFTQLFMNTDFRRFMSKAEVRDPQFSQNLLFETQKLFGFMQGSIRRFMDPEDCVAAIKTYDDTQIDIHNQMDVDEFYNLLFDRWEGQLLNAEAKRQFRSFYGGQLVQQVKSNECDHISERLEPFSAIQCDIKGKSTLEESLQAYVDGEIMQGDNKYKCSTCDRHVDAVKRACLKDIPDNLIFHLKRFDFNLRTLQRSKINDYFTFPRKIDMRPYTIEHLSNESGGTPEAVSEDMFELVGILVHAGTAESGHYYSYIRERPPNSDTEVWLEFNDDVVSSWDPSQIESACFGGADYRPPFDANGILYDKTYSAYMLFYQRSSNLATMRNGPLQGASLLRRGAPHIGPVQVPIGPELEQHMRRENMSLLRRHCLFDANHENLVQTALKRLHGIHAGCSADHAREDLGMDMALSHLDQVASRTKDTPHVPQLMAFLRKTCTNCTACSVALLRYFHARPEAFRMLVQKNTEPEIRVGCSRLVTLAALKVRNDRPAVYGLAATYSTGGDASPDSRNGRREDDGVRRENTVIYGMICLCRRLLDCFDKSLRSWPEVFHFMLSFVTMGFEEMRAFLDTTFLRTLLQTICADAALANDLPQNIIKIANASSRRTPNRPLPYEDLLTLINELFLRSCVPDETLHNRMMHTCLRHGEAEDDGDRYQLNYSSVKMLYWDWTRNSSNIFMEKLIAIEQNTEATDSILVHLIGEQRSLEEKLLRTLRANIHGHVPQYHNYPFLRVASAVFCRYARRPEAIRMLMTHINHECMILQNNEGGSFLEFQVNVFEGPRENTGESPQQILLCSIEAIPEWAPGLLAYFDSAIAKQTEAFLVDRLFGQDAESPAGLENGASVAVANKVREAGRRLALQLLAYLRETYLNRNQEVPGRLVAQFERVINMCSRFFDLNEPVEDDAACEFIRLRHVVLEPLRQLAIPDDLSEDGSEWENSSMEGSLGDISMQTGGDLQDGELQ